MQFLKIRYWMSDHHELRCWIFASMIMIFIVGMIVIAGRMIIIGLDAIGRERFEWLSIYPDPACEICGEIKDGHSCQCKLEGE